MKKMLLFNDGWTFCPPGGSPVSVDLPHTWNGKDGQDGGNDYVRCSALYSKNFAAPDLSPGDRCLLLFKGVNSQSTVKLNGAVVCRHEGGYSAFCADITDHISSHNLLEVTADNSPVENVYPQTADFTFYGGIYRDVYLVIQSRDSFTFGDYCSPEIAIDSRVCGSDGIMTVRANVRAQGEYRVEITVYDGEKIVAEGEAGEEITIPSVHLWNGTRDPFLYTVRASLITGGKECDSASAETGFRTFRTHPDEGFFLNGESYPLRGVSRHQDRPDIGNAIDKSCHEEDIALIREVGANAVRLAHYQHDDYFYSLCDKYGLVVWAEIPYISRHMNGADDNAVQQMKELIAQQYNHPSICFWGISNEITMKHTDADDMMRMHRMLNDMCHRLDPSRLTTLACYASCGPANKIARITDAVGWNLYLGWYAPGLFLNKLWLRLYRLLNPGRCLSFSEYGAEGMPNIHSAKPKRFDNSEEYQAIYHEYMLNFFSENKCIWGSFVWNMFDFAADGRNQGGDPGKNHKGLITFDRKTKKDAFYLYKTYWSDRPVLHLCGKRYVNRAERTTTVTVYSNAGRVKIFNNSVLVAQSDGQKVFRCRIKLEKENEIVAECGDMRDSMTVYRVSRPDPSYIVTEGNSMSWEK